LKPDNILVTKDHEIKLADFGLAVNLNTRNPSRPMSTYVVTQPYRAPELLLEKPYYNGAIDMWSLGVIFAELLSKKALFRNGLMLTNIRKFLISFDTKFSPSEYGVQTVKLLKSMLEFDPMRRISVFDALQHQYFYTK
jgi:serine/threonine protein kinase